MKIQRNRKWSDDLRLITMRPNTFGKKFWKLDAESKLVDILEELPFNKVVNFNKLSHFYSYRQTIIGKTPNEKPFGNFALHISG